MIMEELFMKTDNMHNIFYRELTDNDVYVECENGEIEGNGSFAITTPMYTICGEIPTKEEANDLIPDVVRTYNKLMSTYGPLIISIIVYDHYIERFNNSQPWKNTINLNTPELYKAYIKGMESCIIQQIQMHIKCLMGYSAPLDLPDVLDNMHWNNFD